LSVGSGGAAVGFWPFATGAMVSPAGHAVKPRPVDSFETSSSVLPNLKNGIRRV